MPRWSCFFISCVTIIDSLCLTCLEGKVTGHGYCNMQEAYELVSAFFMDGDKCTPPFLLHIRPFPPPLDRSRLVTQVLPLALKERALLHIMAMGHARGK